MVNNLLFRWEDSQALQHHCGFCDRPLSHPGARASCFGTHAEPCHRFHQTMFMRNRAHMCNYCSAIDEAHYKRHHELVEYLRAVYDSCELDWTILPTEPGDPDGERLFDASSPTIESDYRSIPPEETAASKRERKDAKCLARAASRARVVTQDEIKYVEYVLHSTENTSNNDSSDPANVEEMQLIESHLRYNAHVYNSHSSRHALKRFAQMPDVDVDFDAEMERILDTFRITELVKRNLRNRGLQGKEFKIFEASVEIFKSAVVEDLVLVKKDMMEVRMRRAGYLRYTNKTAYSIVEDRYTDKDWKTGERITFSCSDSGSLTPPTEDSASSPSEATKPTVWPAPPVVKGPDQRHLQHIHTRVSGDDGIGQKVIEPYHAPLLPLTPNITSKRPAVLQLKIVENKENKIPNGFTNRGWLRRDVARQATSNRPLSILDHKQTSPPWLLPNMPTPSNALNVPVTPNWSRGAVAHTNFPVKSSPVVNRPTVNDSIFPPLESRVKAPRDLLVMSIAPAVQTPPGDVTTSLRGPERILTPDNDPTTEQPIVSQKKAKKGQREAKRKAKKTSGSEEQSNMRSVDDVDRQKVPLEMPDTLLDSSKVNQDSESSSSLMQQSYAMNTKSPIDQNQDSSDAVAVLTIKEHLTLSGSSIVTSPLALPCTTQGKHDHWTRFVRNFAVDQLTDPFLQYSESCSHGSSCVFDSHGVIDCPYHEPHCGCVDPLKNQCFLVHPSKQMCSSGPYNRAHGERLITTYERHESTKGRVMLVDDDLVSYLMDEYNKPGKPDYTTMPARLLREHNEFLDGYERGPLMKQELEFERLLVKNAAMKRPVTMRMLSDIQLQNIKLEDTFPVCYCHVEVQNVSDLEKEFSKGFVRCSYGKCEFGGLFHKHCIKKLGSEKVSRWYCIACEKKMVLLARKTLKLPPVDKAVVVGHTKKVVANMMQNPGGLMDHFKSRLQELYANMKGTGLDVEDVD